MRTVRCIIKGRVQGVWFRGSTQTEAHALGIAGWAKNLPDGSVEVVARGDDAAIEALLAWLRRGPRLARVDAVEVSGFTGEVGNGFTVG